MRTPRARPTALAAFWTRHCAALPAGTATPGYTEAFSFGDSAALAARLLALVLSGEKTATSILVGEREARGRALRRVGDESIVLGGRGDGASASGVRGGRRGERR